MPLVEVVPHHGTDPKVSARTLELFKSLGKKPILVRQELPGFVANRLQAALIPEAFSLVSRGVITAEELGMSKLCPLLSSCGNEHSLMWK